MSEKSFIDIVNAAAASRVFPACKEVPSALRDLCDWIASGRPYDRQVLADLIAGKYNRPGGRPGLTDADKARRDGLISAARQKRSEFREDGKNAGEATRDAAKWAANDPRNTEGRKWRTLRRDLQRSTKFSSGAFNGGCSNDRA